ncbi:MAG: hypothetical protein DCC71_23675 [Proteobacteria bacterium]|nr:MAG: hypothetical protein DCC71_23675 [Pseudomonadota bacterium]
MSAARGSKRAWGAIALAALALGCGSVAKPYAEPVMLAAPRAPLALPVRLDLASLRRGELPGENHGYEERRLVGEALAANAARVARAAFRDVADARGRPVLRPRVVFLEIGSGGAGFSRDLCSLVLEWALVADGDRTVWIETVGATDHDVRTAVEQTLRASLDALVRAPELRRYAEHGLPQPPEPVAELD